MKTYLPVEGQGVTPEGRIVGYDADWGHYNAEPLGIGTLVARKDTFETLEQALNSVENFDAFVCEPHDDARVVVTDLWDRADCLNYDDAYRASETHYYNVHSRPTFNEDIIDWAESLTEAVNALIEIFLNPTTEAHASAMLAIDEAAAHTEADDVILYVHANLGEEGDWTEAEFTQRDIAFIRNACRVAKAMELSRTPGQITFSVAA